MNSITTVEVRDLRTDWVWANRAVLLHPEITGNTFKVYCGLSSFSNNTTQQSFPSVRTLGTMLHLSTNTVLDALKKLEQLALIRIEKSEGEHNIYFLLKVAEDETTSERKKKAAAGEEKNWVKAILIWAEERKGGKFVNYGRQVNALGAMQKAEYTVDDIKRCYELMEKNEFWRQRGFDFTNVATELPKKVAQIRQSHGIFDHLTNR